MVIKEQVNIFELGKNSIILIDSRSVYEIMEVSEELEVKVLTYQRSFISKIGLKFNRLNIYHNIRMELRRGYTFTDREFEVLGYTERYRLFSGRSRRAGIRCGKY